MSIEHVSRSGKIYYLHQKPGKTGKPNYFFSCDEEGTRVDAIPAGYEIYENVAGQVFLRRIPKKIITDEELQKVRAALNARAEEWVYKIDVKKNIITIYETDKRESGLAAHYPWVDPGKEKQFRIQNAYYMAVLRFILVDVKPRHFVAERFCFRGSVEDWIGLSAPALLPALLKKYLPHLGKESFYELF